VHIILPQHKLEQHFDDIIISGEVGYVKPSRELFELALEKMGLSASETIFIDDLQPYIEGVRAIGITGVKFDNIAQLTADLEKPGIITH
jgi:HAD superfamily hydrolase (TIGR01509 family)